MCWNGVGGVGIQFRRRMGEVMLMNATVQIRSMEWVGEILIDGRMGRVMVMNAIVQMRSMVRVREMQFS